MRREQVWAAGLFTLAAATGTAAATTVDQAASTVTTLLGIAILLWVVGNILTYHRYDHGGPKGGPLKRP